MAQEDKPSGKLGPQSGRTGSNVIYPGFYGTVPAGFGRLRRLEKGSQRLQRGQFRPTVGTYTRLPSTSLHTNINFQQVVDLSKSTIRKVGGVSTFGAGGQFTYTSTTSSITFYWDGSNSSVPFVITRADGSKFTVPTTGSGLTISSLSAATTYYFLPFWDTDNLCNIGWVEGTVGSPQIAFVAADKANTLTQSYLIEQSSQTREPLTSGFMSAATPAAGSGGGGAGGGGGGGGCVRAGTEIYTVGDLPYHVEVLPEQHWIHLRIEDGRELYCTLDHPLYDTFKGRVTADTLSPGDVILTDVGEQKITTAEFKFKACSKYKVMMEKGHLFWANGFLSHNKMPVPP